MSLVSRAAMPRATRAMPPDAAPAARHDSYAAAAAAAPLLMRE